MPDGARYDEDFHLWSSDQARRLREAAHTGGNLNIDWENVAEEIESLGRSDKRELESRLDLIFEHLLKLAFSPAADPRNGWIDTVERERREVERLLKDSPSLTRFVQAWTDQPASVVKRTASTLARYGETDAAIMIKLGSGDDLAGRVLEDGFIPHPPGSATSG